MVLHHYLRQHRSLFYLSKIPFSECRIYISYLVNSTSPSFAKLNEESIRASPSIISNTSTSNSLSNLNNHSKIVFPISFENQFRRMSIQLKSSTMNQNHSLSSTFSSSKLNTPRLFPEGEWRRRLKEFIEDPEETEMILREKEYRKFEQEIKQLAEDMGIYSVIYEKIQVISKQPLPQYRPDLDFRRPQRQFTISDDVRRRVDKKLQEIWKWKSFQPTVLPLTKETNVCKDMERNVEEIASASSSSDSMIQNEKQQEWSERLKEKQDAWMMSEEGKRMMDIRCKLPAFKQRDSLLESIDKNQVLVVSGETGCGKTTQLPQYILEHEIASGRGSLCDIICTQPRRISAISVAERVAAERGEEIGSSIGYQVRLEGRRTKETSLLFCTTGILLRRLSRDPKLKGVTHVLIDEIHERGMNEDFLLIVLRDLLPRRPDLKLILMSATLNSELFSTYFKNAPTAHIPGFTHPVKTYFLENVLEMTGYRLTHENQIDDYGANKFWKQQRQLQSIIRRRKNKINILAEEAMTEADFSKFNRETQSSLANWNGDSAHFNLIETVLTHIVLRAPPGSILVFMTGSEEINALLMKLRTDSLLGNKEKVLLLGCHGSMSSQEQKLIFQTAPPGVRKIVLATNIAETSITINDCVYVIDCGKAKETSYDALNNVPCLLPSWISKASAKQRRGRAGRVQPGVCFHLYPEPIHEALEDYTPPELLRTPLHSLCLQIKSLKLGKIKHFLSKALQPPEPLAVEHAISLLRDVGALDENEDLTALGRHLTALPLEPRVGKMLIMGAIFKCLRPILTVAAGFAERDPWLMPMGQKDLAESRRADFYGDDCSDHLALVRGYDTWTQAVNNGVGREFCHNHFLSFQTLMAMSGLRNQFLNILSQIGLVNTKEGPTSANLHSENTNLIKAVIFSGLFPGIASAVKRQRSTTFKTREDGTVNLHPSSPNSKIARFPFPWIVFNEKLKTSSVFIRDSTGVSDSTMLLFGGKLISGEKLAQPGYLGMLEGYFEFFLSDNIAKTFLTLRKELDDLIQRKLENPSIDIHEEGKPVIDCMLDILQCDHGVGNFIFGRVPKVKKLPKSSEQRKAAVVSGVDVKNKVHNYCKKLKYGHPRFQCESMGPRNRLVYVSTCHVRGKIDRRFKGKPALTKRQAEQNAASTAWEFLMEEVKRRKEMEEEELEKRREMKLKRQSFIELAKEKIRKQVEEESEAMSPFESIAYEKKRINYDLDDSDDSDDEIVPKRKSQKGNLQVAKTIRKTKDKPLPRELFDELERHEDEHGVDTTFSRNSASGSGNGKRNPFGNSSLNSYDDWDEFPISHKSSFLFDDGNDEHELSSGKRFNRRVQNSGNGRSTYSRARYDDVEDEWDARVVQR